MGWNNRWRSRSICDLSACAESSDRQNSRSSSLSSIVLAWRAVTSERPTGREGRHFCRVQTHRYCTVEQSSTLHNSPSSSVQQRAVILRAMIFFIVTHCNMAQVYSTCLRYAYVLFCVCLACSSLACVKLCLGSERENPRECFALESVGSNPTHSTSPFQFPSLLSFLTSSIFTKRYLVGFVFQIAENIRVVKPIFPPSSRVHFRASLRFLGS